MSLTFYNTYDISNKVLSSISIIIIMIIISMSITMNVMKKIYHNNNNAFDTSIINIALFQSVTLGSGGLEWQLNEDI